jgi:hypothetical protein
MKHAVLTPEKDSVIRETLNAVPSIPAALAQTFVKTPHPKGWGIFMS